MASVTIRNIDKSFGKTRVLSRVSLEVKDSEFVVLVGPSGCGKSTLLRILAGLEEMSGGEIHIGGKDVSWLEPKDRDIAMVFQSYALYPHMTVAQNMAFSMKIRKVSAADTAARVSSAAEILGLSALLERYPKQLSGGQRQRVAMGRAIVRDPKVFLFDEPLSNLDAKLRIAMRTELKALHQRLRTTTIYVTHDQVEAMTMADRIVVMRDGVIEQEGEPLALYDLPVNLFVAGFIGSPAMNFIRGSLDLRNGPCVRTSSGGALPVAARSWGSAEDGQNVIYGIRPEHLELTTGEGLELKAVVVEPTGAETQIYGRMAGSNISAIFKDRQDIKPDETIRVRPRLGAVHLFDAGTERRL